MKVKSKTNYESVNTKWKVTSETEEQQNLRKEQNSVKTKKTF